MKTVKEYMDMIDKVESENIPESHTGLDRAMAFVFTQTFLNEFDQAVSELHDDGFEPAEIADIMQQLALRSSASF